MTWSPARASRGCELDGRMNLPLDSLRTLALRELSRADAAPLFVTISGAHLYGFASHDSDFDVRACHLLPLRRVLSLAPREETIEHSSVEDGREIDFVSHDAGKFFRMMLKKNGYVMEQVFSPLVVCGGPALDELRPIARGCITKHIYHHYRGFSENELDFLRKDPEKKIKRLLYVYRVLLSGIHVLRTGEIEANLPRLLELHPQVGVEELIATKAREGEALAGDALARHEAAVDRLRAGLTEAFERSSLPEEPARAGDLDGFLVRLRLATPPSSAPGTARTPA